MMEIVYFKILLLMTISLAGWNMRSLSQAGPYIDYLCHKHDIIVASEHRLYEQELHKLQQYFPCYIIHAKASSDLKQDQYFNKPGHCGLCIAWHQSLSGSIRTLNTDSDRICAIQLC